MDVEVISVDDDDGESNEEGEVGELESEDGHDDDDFEIFSQEKVRYQNDDGNSPNSSNAETSPSFGEAAANTATIDLTMTAPETAQDFEQEYDALRRNAQGFMFPFESVSELLLRHSEHWWCRYTDAMTEMLLSLEGGLEDETHAISHATGVSIVWQQSSLQLSSCKRCLRCYHAAKERVILRLLSDEERPVDIKRLTTTILEQDSKRLQRSFRSAQKAPAPTSASAIMKVGSRPTATGVAIGQVPEAGSVAAMVTASASLAPGMNANHAFWEVLSYSQLLEDSGIQDAFVAALARVTSSGADIFSGEEWNQHWPGVLTLLVHKDASVRAWAQLMARRAGKIRAKEYVEVLSPVIDQWVPVLEQGLIGSGQPVAAVSERGEEERLHWSGLHVALQLLEPSAGRLVANGFQTLVDLALQKFDNGPGHISLYLQVCGCLASLLRLLGAGIWDYSSRQPSEVLEAFERQIRHEGDDSVLFGVVGAGGRTLRPPNEAIHKKVLEMLPLLVSSVARECSSSQRVGGGMSGDVPYGSGESLGEGREESGMMVGGRDDGPIAADSFSLADEALGFLSRDVALLSALDANHGANRRRKMALARTLLDVLEICYNGTSSGGGGASGHSNDAENHDGDPLSPESWPWNSAATGRADHAVSSSWWHPSWPVRSVPLWGPRLADIAGDRSSRSSGGTSESGSTSGGGALVVDRAARVVELVLRQHSRAAWRKTLATLRPRTLDSGSAAQKSGGVTRKEAEDKGEVLPLCGPLLERICLELPLMDLPVRVHAAVFEAHGWLSLLPCGDSAIRAAENRCGPQASRSLAQLHSGMISQFLKLFVPYVEGLTKTVKSRGASVSPALLPQVVPHIFQALLAAVPAARAALEELLLCSVVSDRRFGDAREVFKKGDLRPVLARLPLDCARACFLAVPQALGAMAAAGPHLTLKSWSPLFQAVGVLGCAVLLPPTSGFSDPRRRGGEGDDEEYDNELWGALEGVWEFIFLQVLPEALPALREQHATRLEDAIRALFGSLESLWPLLTGPVPRSRRPQLADDFYRSRSLWLQPLLAWVSEAWLPLPAREAAAGFVQRALLPLLHSSSRAPPAGAASGKGADQSVFDHQGVSAAASPKSKTRQLRLMGAKLCAVEEEQGRGEGGNGDEFGSEAEEAKILQALESAASAATTTVAVDPSPVQAAPEGSPEVPWVGLGPSEPTNPFVRTAVPLPGAVRSRERGGSSVASEGWSSTPWQQRLGVASSSPHLTSAGGASSRPSSSQSVRSPPAAPASRFRNEIVRSSAAGEARRDRQRSAVELSPEELPNHQQIDRSSAVGGAQGSRNQTASSARRREEKLSSISVQMGSWAGSNSATVVAAVKANSTVGSSGADDGKEYANTAEAAAYVSRAEEVVAARPRGSVVERWREMQRKQMEETQEPASVGSQKGPHQVDQRAQARLSTDAAKAIAPARPETVASHSAAANAAFAAAARATASRGNALEGGAKAREPVERPVDYTSLAEASSMELHRLVLSTWTIPELLAAPMKSARQGASEGQDRRWLSSLWLPKVPTRFQSAEQYVDIFRGLLLEEIFATLGAALKGGGEGGGGRGGGRPSEAATLSVESFVETGKEGFSHITMVASDGSSRGGGRQDQGAGGVMAGYFPRFVHDDVLLLSLVERSGGNDDSLDGSANIACLGIFDKEPRGSARGAAGPPGRERSSIRAKVFFRPSAAADRRRDESSNVEKGSIPKKVTPASPENGEDRREEDGPAGAILRAFREPGTLVRVTRLEGLSTSTREFVALEATPTRGYLLHHLLQATSNPRLLPVPPAALRPRNNNTNSPNPRTTLGPPYPVDEASFTDTCKRLSSVEGSLLGVSGGGDRTAGNRRPSGRGEDERPEGRHPDSGGISGVDKTVPTDLLMRSLGCLASFRLTSELLTSHGRGTATRLKRISKSQVWSPEARDAAARLLHTWRGVVDVSSTAQPPEVDAKLSRAQERGDDEGGRKVNAKGKRGVAHVKDRAVAAAAVSGRGDEAKKEEDTSRSKRKSAGSSPDKGAVSSRHDQPPKHSSPPQQLQGQNHQRSPERPSLVPAALWDRLSQEFNSSQLSAIWAAAASALEARQEGSKAVSGTIEAGGTEHVGGVEAEPIARRTPVIDAAMASRRKSDEGAHRGGGKGGVVLLQGPPGTGKTRTILGVVSAILARGEEKDVAGRGGSFGSGGGSGPAGSAGGSSAGVGNRGMGTTLEVGTKQKRPGLAGRWAAAKTHQRMLVCAPSNGAVDELTNRLALESGGVWDHRGKAFAPRIVRLGKPSEEAPGRVKGVSLEVMVEERVKLHAKSTEARNAEMKVREAYAHIEEAGRALRSGGADAGEIPGVAGIGTVENRRHQLTIHIRRLRGEVLVAKQRRRDALRGLEVERGRIRRSLVSNAQVVCATLSACGSAPLVEAVSLTGKGFDTVIVDEACQATEPSTLIPLSLGCIRLILVGDPRQLPATVISQRAARLNLEISLFERLESAGHPVHMLTVQYRMHPEIRAFPSERFYDGRLTDAPCVRGEVNQPAAGVPLSSTEPTAVVVATSKPHRPPRPLGPCFPPFLVVDVTSGSERRVGSSYQNPWEASFVAAFLSRLVVSGLRDGRGIKSAGDSGGGTAAGSGTGSAGVIRVGVITPYRGQVQCIRQELGSSRRLKGGAEDGGVEVEVSTVDGFQGKEVDVVLFSCVRAPSSLNTGYGGRGGGRGGIGFLADRRRMNVAITRAKRSLVVLGNTRRLSSDTTWKALVDHAKSRERLVSDMADFRGGRGGEGGRESGEALCARLEAKYDASKSGLKGISPSCTRNPDRGLDAESSPNENGVHDGSAGTCPLGGDGDAEEKKHGKARSGQRSSTQQPGSDTETLGRKAADNAPAVEERRTHSLGKSLDRRLHGNGVPHGRQEKPPRSAGATRPPPPVEREGRDGQDRKRTNLNRRHDAGGDSSTSRRRKTTSLSAGETRSPPVQGAGGAERDHRLAQQAEAVAAGVMGTGAISSPVGNKRRESRADIPRKRARVAGPEPKRGDISEREKSCLDTGTAKRQSSCKSTAGGFLAGLLNSVAENASGIASGKEYEIRQGLRGGEDDERKRAAAGPRLGGARVTELSHPPTETFGPSLQGRHSPRPSTDSRNRPKVADLLGKDSRSRRSHRQIAGRSKAETFTSGRSGSHGTTSRGSGASSTARSSSNRGHAERVSSSTSSVVRVASNSSSSSHAGSRGDVRRNVAGADHRRSPEERNKRARPVQPAVAGRGDAGNPSVGTGSRRPGGATRPPAPRNYGAAGIGRVGARADSAKKGGAKAGKKSVAGMGVLDILKDISDTWGDSSAKKKK